MRTLTTAQTALLQSGALQTFCRVFVDSTGQGAYVNLASLYGYEWVKEVSWTDAVDNPCVTAQVTLNRQVAGLSLSPFMTGSKLNNGAALLAVARKLYIQTATVTPGTVPQESDYVTMFMGSIDDIDPGPQDVVINCRDLGALLQDTFIEVQNIYGTIPPQVPNPSAPGTFMPGLIVTTPIATVMQAIVNDHINTPLGTSIVLQTIGIPTFALAGYQQEKAAVLDALQQLADQMGWKVRYRWDSVSQAFQLTLYQPKRNALEGLPTTTLTQPINSGTYGPLYLASTSGFSAGSGQANLLPANVATCGDTTGDTTGFYESNAGNAFGVASQSATYAYSQVQAFSGPGSIKITTDGTDYEGIATQVSCLPNRQYTFTCYGITAPNIRISVIAELRDNGSQQAGQPPINKADYGLGLNSSGWQQFTVTLTTRPDATRLELRIYENQQDGVTYYTDSWTLTLTPNTYAGYALIGYGTPQALTLPYYAITTPGQIQPANISSSTPYTQSYPVGTQVSYVSGLGSGLQTQWTFAPSFYTDVTQAKQSRVNVRNRVAVVFTDYTASKTRNRIVRDDALSQSQYGLRYMEIAEDASAQINTPTQAAAMGDAALSDLSQPLIDQIVTMPYFFPVDINDFLLWKANGIHYDTDQALSVISYTHTINATEATTEIECTGVPRGGYARWLRIEGRQGNAPTAALVDPTAPTAVAQGSPSSIVVTYDSPDPSTWGTTEIYVNGPYTPGVSPSFQQPTVQTVDSNGNSLTKYQRPTLTVGTTANVPQAPVALGKQTRFVIDGLTPGTTYQVAVVVIDYAGNIGQMSEVTESTAQQIGPYHANPASSGVQLVPNNDFNIYTQDKTANPPDAWGVLGNNTTSNGYPVTDTYAGTWNAALGGAYWTSSDVKSGALALRLSLDVNGQGTSIVSRAIPILASSIVQFYMEVGARGTAQVGSSITPVATLTIICLDQNKSVIAGTTSHVMSPLPMPTTSAAAYTSVSMLSTVTPNTHFFQVQVDIMASPTGQSAGTAAAAALEVIVDRVSVIHGLAILAQTGQGALAMPDYNQSNGTGHLRIPFSIAGAGSNPTTVGFTVFDGASGNAYSTAQFTYSGSYSLQVTITGLTNQTVQVLLGLPLAGYSDNRIDPGQSTVLATGQVASGTLTLSVSIFQAQQGDLIAVQYPAGGSQIPGTSTLLVTQLQPNEV